MKNACNHFSDYQLAFWYTVYVFFAAKMAGEMKLSYFNFRGRAEIIRYLFNLAGKEFIDSRIQGEEWQKFKPCK